ncbi:MAG TPA: flagellar biosynthesis anti-sigma factor FlgM [Candidatus Acidoferrum sp.]|nr:flagellar biosynthesis anti-sigma factor FlgM [Candidatus Acidoferrum sp.]
MANEIKLSNATPSLGTLKPQAKSVTADGKTATAGKTAQGDRVSMTDDASRLKRIEEHLSAMPDIDHDKVAEIKKAIADGSWTPDPQKIADKLVDFESSYKN